jgi:transposase
MAFVAAQGHIRTVTHDYYRHGTVTLFAALDYLSGKVISQVAPRHRHNEWLKFLKKLDSQIAEDLSIHLIVDNYSTHKHQKVRHWLERHPRFYLHFTPTSASWMNMVERFFRDLSQQAILPGSFGSVAELVDTINRYLAQHNLEPKRYVWHAHGQEVLKSMGGCHFLKRFTKQYTSLAALEPVAFWRAHSSAILVICREE